MIKTTIKIHDTKWFKENCKVTAATNDLAELRPKHDAWKHNSHIPWTHGANAMGPLEGQVLEVEYDDGDSAGKIVDARYKVCEYWIPNWAIEWVKEEQTE